MDEKQLEAFSTACENTGICSKEEAVGVLTTIENMDGEVAYHVYGSTYSIVMDAKQMFLAGINFAQKLDKGE